MKTKLLKLIIVVLAVAVLTTSCVNDLNPVSLGAASVNSATVYKTVSDYQSGLAKLYSAFAQSGQQGPSGNPDIINVDEGFANYLREYWNLQELPTDEAVYSWAEDGNIRPLHWQTWTSTNTFSNMMFTRIMLAVTYCNEFIRASAGSTDPNIKQFHAEARFLRALAYYHGLDIYGSPPFVTESDAPGAFFPPQTNPKDLFNYIDSELTAIESQMGAARFQYGRADQATLWMLQAKLYLNAEVYLGAGNGKYTQCLTALNKVIAAGYTLEPNYFLNFSADNNTSREMIFAFNYDGASTQSYGGSDYIINGEIGGNMDPTNYGTTNKWAQNRVTPEFVAKFATANDHRGKFYTNGQTLQIADVGDFTNGYAVTKFTNLTASGGQPPSQSRGGNIAFVDTDFPIFRLADAYLMYAEAVVRGGSGGDVGTATTYLNNVIERAYGNSSADHATLSVNSSNDLNFILDERARELYWECSRRTDLIRYGLLTGSSYLWTWKGNVQSGAATPAYLNLFPIPAVQMSSNPNLKQNTGYN